MNELDSEDKAEIMDKPVNWKTAWQELHRDAPWSITPPKKSSPYSQKSLQQWGSVREEIAAIKLEL